METHEPAEPINWPDGHVSSEYVDDVEVEECICVTIHGVKHYLHSTTARELARSIADTLENWNRHAFKELGKLGIRHKPV